MATRTIAGTTVDVNDEGFMTNPAQWNKDIAAEIASEEGIAELSATHWQVIDFCRQSAAKSGNAPTLRSITNGAGVSTKDLFASSPRDPPKKSPEFPGWVSLKAVSN